MALFERGRLRCSAALVTVAMMTASASHGATVELVTNGGFESGNVGFTTEHTNANGGFPGLATVSVLSTNYFGLNASSGSSFLAVNGSNSAGSLPTVWAQDVSVVAGTEYAFSFDLGGTSAAPTPVGQLSVQFNGTEILNASAPASASYLSFGTTFTAMATGTFALSFVEQSVGFGGNDYGLDNISLLFDDGAGSTPPPVPLPAGGVLLLTGLGAGALLRRKRQKA